MRDQQTPRFGPEQAVDAFGHHAQRVDVQAGVGLVEHGDLRIEHRHLQDFGTLLLAAGETVVQVAPRKGLIDVQLCPSSR